MALYFPSEHITHVSLTVCEDMEVIPKDFCDRAFASTVSLM